jgi:hypothetical protein
MRFMDVNRGLSVTTPIWYGGGGPIRIEHGPNHSLHRTFSKDQFNSHKFSL